MTAFRALSVAATLLGLPNIGPAQRLAAPATALMDEVLDVRASGLRAGQQVTLRATAPDSAGRSWRAIAEFVADRRGEIRLKRDAPVAGAYVGVNPMGLVTAMDLAERAGGVRYISPGLGDVPLGLALLVDGRVVDSVMIVRHFLIPGVRVVPTHEPHGPVGTLFLSPDRPPAPGILVLGGSEGGNSAADVAAQLAAHGYVTLSLAYFGWDALPSELDEIPLEYFTRAITFLRSRPEVDSTAIAIFGSSKGAEAALLVAASDTRVRAVIAYAPSSVVWSCLCSQPTHSSWSFRGAPVPSLAPETDPHFAPVPGQPERPAVDYRYGLEHGAARDAAAIQVGRIRGPVLLVAGDADQLWPSGEMARRVQAQLAATSRPAGDIALIYPDAGHFIGKSYLPAGSTQLAGGRIETGGSAQANALAQADAWPKVLRFLEAATGLSARGE